jgi:hypothetical protein
MRPFMTRIDRKKYYFRVSMSRKVRYARDFSRMGKRRGAYRVFGVET